MPSDSNKVSVFYAKEDAWGETPDLGSALQELGCSSAAIKPENVFEESAEIRADSQLANDTKVGEEVTATIATQLSMRALNDFFPAVLGAADWTTVSPGAITCAIATSGQTLTASAGLSVFASARYIKVAGAATTANNGLKKIVSVTDTVITCAAGSFTAIEASPSLTITAKYVQVGTVLQGFLLEEKFDSMNAGSNIFKYATGQSVNRIALDIQPKSIVKATIDFMGKTGGYSATTMGDGSPLSKTGLPHITTNANVGTIYWGGTALPATIPIQSLPLQITRNLRVRPALGQQNTLEFGLNQFDFTGNMNSYFLNDDLVQDMVASTKRALEFYLNDSAGKLLNFYSPLVLLKRNGHPDPTAKNTDVMAGFEFRGLGSDALKALQIDYLEA